jgi:hypothetical protein
MVAWKCIVLTFLTDAKSMLKAAWLNPLLTAVILPILPTLVGVYVALLLENGRQKSESREKARALIVVSQKECEEVIKALSHVAIENQPVPLPTLGISLVNLLQQPELLRSLKPNDFADFVSNYGKIRSNSEEYQRSSVEYHNLETAPLTVFAPKMLPVPVGQKMPETKEEAEAMFAKAQTELRGSKAARLNDVTQNLRLVFAGYTKSVRGFCDVTTRAKDYIE